MLFSKISLISTLIFLAFASFAQEHDDLEIKFDETGKLVYVFGDGEDILKATAMLEDGVLVAIGTPNSIDNRKLYSHYFESGWTYYMTFAPNGYPMSGASWKRKDKKDKSTETTKKSIPENLILVYPNPSSGIFNIKITDSENEGVKNIEVFNISGKNIQLSDFETIKPSEYQINLTTHPQGVYFIKISSEKVTVVKKIIKE